MPRQHTNFVSLVSRALEQRYRRFFLLYPVTVAGWIAGFAGLLDRTVLATILLAATLVYYLAAMLVLSASNISQRRRYRILESREAAVRALSARLGESLANLVRDRADYYSHRLWHETMTIAPNGDTRIERVVELSPGSLGGVDLVFAHLYGPPTDRVPTGFSFKAFQEISQDAQVRMPVSSIWDDSNSRFSAFIHLDRNYASGERVRVRCVWHWPSYSPDLARGEKETHTIRLSRACEDFRCRTVIEPGTGGPGTQVHAEPLSGKEFTAQPGLSTKNSSEGWVCEISLRDQPAEARFGVGITPYDKRESATH